MLPIPMTLNDLESHLLLFESFISHIPLEIELVLTTICLQINQKAHVACNVDFLIETEGLLKVAGSHVHFKYGNGAR